MRAKQPKEDRAFLRLTLAALLVHFLVALAVSPFRDFGDMPHYKVWANHAVDQGIHRAYSWGYDWLPFYLYLSKLVGLAYRALGLLDTFGPYSAVLTLMLKVPMILLNVLIAGLIYRLVGRFYGKAGQPLVAAGIYLFNPAIILATDLLGYQDALHTSLVLLAVFALCTGREGWAAVPATLAFLTKPQAALFLLPIGAVLFLRTGFRGIARGAAAAGLTAGAVLMPFIVHGELASVFGMYLNVPRVHQWLSGCAHNLWWLFWPGPPFHSDRTPLLLGLNGLTIGLLLFGLFTAGTLVRLVREPTGPALVHACAFLAFAFFMVVTEIHENHLYAMFGFLAIFVPVSSSLRSLYAGLTVTFALGMALTLRLLDADGAMMLGPVRLSQLNALANVAMLGIWSRLVLVRGLAPEPEARAEPARRPSLVTARSVRG